jgi:Tol biopolymer transport system component
MIVSAGYPTIAYGDGRDLRLMQGFDGKSVKTLVKTADVEDEPSWQPGGTLIAYRRGPTGDSASGRIWLVDSKNPARPRPLTTGPDDRRPAFSPDGSVVAYIHRSAGSDGDLCFVRVRASSPRSACIVDPDVSVERPTWAPDGSAILLVAFDPKDADQNELFEYTSPRPSSARPSDWVPRGLVTDSMHGKRRFEGVAFAAWAPDGKSVALVANWGATNLGVHRVFLAPTNQNMLAQPTPVKPIIRACSVAWRSDSAELAVMQADDCNAGLGTIVRVDPKKPQSLVSLRQPPARDPAWQFISLSGR